MKSVSRLVTLILVLLLAVFAFSGCQQGPKPVYPGGKPTIEDAQKLESEGKPDDAYVELIDVKNGAGNDRELGAKALLLAARLESDPVRCCRYGGLKPGDPGLSADARQQIVDKQTQAEIKAHEALKELLKDLAGTKAAEEAIAQNLQPELEKRIDDRNKTQWSYKLIDALVAATGRQQGFSYWFALLLISLIVKGVTLPLQLRMYKSQRETQRLQPAIKKLQEKYKDDPQESQKRVMEFYKEHGVNPFASCFPMLIQLPFMIWVYNTIRLYEFHFAHGTFLWVNPASAHWANHSFGRMLSFVPDPVAANLGQFDLALLIIYTASMYLTMKLTPATDPAAAQQQQSMSVMTTGMMFFFFIKYRWSAAFVFYWLILNVLSAAQSYYFVYKPNKDNPVVPVALPDDKPAKTNGSGGSAKTAPVKPTAALAQATTSSPSRPRRPRKPRPK
ncbi:MAG TPA: YidC/Oxa1 family membrane protein insertase [Chthonomonadaceae bacterium]|nr:YidC/Oxa1 family membrane protein insertase [Chthonomonadaceae bacterium]